MMAATGTRTESSRVTTAILLAAGSGRRLLPLTRMHPKCLLEVGEQTILARFVRALQDGGWRRLVIVTGHLAHRIDAFVDAYEGPMEIETVFCPEHEVTNNIVSLHTVRNTVRGPVLIAEADLVLGPGLLAPLAHPNRLAVDRFDPASMHGTTVSLGPRHDVRAMQVGTEPKPVGPLFKTVNLTSLSSEAWLALGRRMDARVRAGDVGCFYEAALSDLVGSDALSLRAVDFRGRPWVEIDSAKDLQIAQRMFAGRRPASEHPSERTSS